jgi:hypothetical protein
MIRFCHAIGKIVKVGEQLVEVYAFFHPRIVLIRVFILCLLFVHSSNVA